MQGRRPYCLQPAIFVCTLQEDSADEVPQDLQDV